MKIYSSSFPRLNRNGRIYGLLLFAFLSIGNPVRAQFEHPAGHGSPRNESDLAVPLSGRVTAIENDDVRLAFDSVSGAMIEFKAKKTGWSIEGSGSLGQSFRAFVPTPDRS